MGFMVHQCSAPSTRRLVTNARIVGLQYQALINRGVSSAVTYLASTLSPQLRATIAQSSQVVNVLRGGLGFDVLGVVGRALMADIPSSFVGTSRLVAGLATDSYVSLDYVRWVPEPAECVWIGDVCASGATMTVVIDALSRHYHERGWPLRRVFVITIGTTAAVAAIERLNRLLVDRHPSTFVGVDMILLEGTYSLGNAASALGTQWPPATDFLRRDAELPIALCRRYSRSLASMLERCALYDSGRRLFEPRAHRDEIRAYWSELQRASLSVSDVLSVTQGGHCRMLNQGGTERCMVHSVPRPPHTGETRHAKLSLKAVAAEVLKQISEGKDD